MTPTPPTPLAVLAIAGALALAGCAATPAAPPAERAPSDAELRAMFCPDGGCREGHMVRLRREDGSLYEQGPQLTYPPVQASGMVSIFPGEEFAFTGRIVDGELVERRLVTAADGEGPRIAVRFWQEKDGQMMLWIKSTFDTPIKYSLGMIRLSEEQPEHTSSCPLRPGLPVYEIWPYPIYQLMLLSAKAVPADSSAASTCE